MSQFLSRFSGPLIAELAAEVGSALALSGKKLQDKLTLLQRFDQDPSLQRFYKRDRLVADAAESLWGYVIQREIIGLGDADFVMEQYCVPAEVRKRMGPALRKREGSA